MELQSSRDPYLPDRLLQYNVLFRVRHMLSVQSVVILLRPEADHSHLSGTHRHHHVSGEFRYHVVRARELPVDEVLAGPPATLPLAPVANVRTEE